MSRLWIKICGLTRPEAARDAARLGADAIGLVFYPPSPRALTVERAREICAGLPDSLQRVALFVDPDPEEVQAVLDAVPIDLLQFHGDESPGFCAQFARPYIKALRVADGSGLEAIAASYGDAEKLLLDKFDAQVPGGTGETFDWRLASGLVSKSPVPVVLAGGLNPGNVREAVSLLTPQGVDVSSGVESAPGQKDSDKIAAFINGARHGRD